MSLSFVSGTFALSTWRFGAADIALLSGAGRNVGTWLMTNLKDRSLFEFLGTDVDTLITRRGLLDVASLHRRWDQRFTLLRNDRRTTFKIESAKGGRVSIQHMDRFTWLMVLFTAALTACMQESDLRETLCLLMLSLLEDQEAAHEFVRHEIDNHISGWRSAACVREVALSARRDWDHLGLRGMHQPGFMPRAEVKNVVRFLLWLARGADAEKVHSTSSTDIFSLAILLGNLGVAVKTSKHANEAFDENQIVVLWTQNEPFEVALREARRERRTGITIPLHHIEEVASIHPSERDEIRAIFEKGMDVVKQDSICIRATYSAEPPPYVTGSPFREDHQDIMYQLDSNGSGKTPRLQGDAFRFAKWFFPLITPALARSLLSVVEDINRSDEERHDLEMLAMAIDSHGRGEKFRSVGENVDLDEVVSKIQSFVLGYWYALLLPLIDTSQLGSPLADAGETSARSTRGDHKGKQAYGAWSWPDISCLNFVRGIAATCLHQRHKHGKIYYFYRLDLLKVVSYLFGGCEARYVREANFGAIGMHGKLTTLYSSLLGCKLENVGKFCLLDIDPTCIPSSTAGIILAGITPKSQLGQPTLTDVSVVENFDITSLSANEDQELTLHVEPDWDHDVQACLVTYRHGGRIVTRLNPCQIDLTLLRAWRASLPASGQPSSSPVRRGSDVEVPLSIAKDLQPVRYSDFHGFKKVPVDDRLVESGIDIDPCHEYSPIIINTVGRWNALVCFLCIYCGWKGDDEVKVITSQEDLLAALEQRKRVLIAH